jgi:hypothetical protein
MGALMFLENTLPSERLMANHKDMFAPHYDCGDVSEDYRCYGMTYCTHHNDMVARHYACDDVSKYCLVWNDFTHITMMRSLPFMDALYMFPQSNPFNERHYTNHDDIITAHYGRVVYVSTK